MTPNPASRPVIAVDIDDVIAAHAPAFVEYSNHKWNTHLEVSDYHDHWGEVWRVDHNEQEKRAVEYHESGFIETYPAIDGASEALKKLRTGYKLVIVTTRRVTIDPLTRRWIEKYYPGVFEEVHFAGIWDKADRNSIKLTKADLAKQIGGNYLIDDQIKHCFAAAEVGIEALLFGDYPWNQVDKLPPGVTRVKNWQEVLEYFDGRS